MLLECCWIQQAVGHQRIRSFDSLCLFSNCRESLEQDQLTSSNVLSYTKCGEKELKSISGDFLEDKSHLTVSAFQLFLLLFVISLHLLLYTFPYFVFLVVVILSTEIWTRQQQQHLSPSNRD